MRTQNSFKNILVALLKAIVINVLRFISRTIFIIYLDSVYLGVNGLLSNVLGVLALADLGIGTAISFALYKPIADNDKEKIKTLMNFYKKAYRIIAIVILLIGLGILPFLDYFIKDGVTVDHLKLYYFLFLFNMVIGYLFSYMRTLIVADQKEYKVAKLNIMSNIIMTLLQIAVIILFKNYIAYLLVQSIMTILENVFVNRYIIKNYPYLKEKNVAKMEKKDIDKIKINIKGLLFHKIGAYFVESTDNLIISKFLGLSVVGLYSNYYLITSTFTSFITSALWSIVSSLGNLNVSEKDENKYKVYKSLNLIGCIVYGIITICLYQLLNLFIGDIWLGHEYLLSTSVVIIICINFYISGMLHISDAIKSSAGLYDEDRYVPVFQAIINIIASIILVKFNGLFGVFLGTLISAILPVIVKPIIIHKNVFHNSSKEYFKNFLKQLIVILISALIVELVNSQIKIGIPLILFIIKGVISVIIPFIIIYLVYRNSDAMKLIIEKVKVILKR